MKCLRLVPAIGLLCCLMPGNSWAQEGFSTLEERMTVREFQEAGLEKLTAEELEALNRWIRERSLAEYEGPDPDTQVPAGPGDTPQDTPQDTPRVRIDSQIIGEFTGWKGGDEFELANGMVWQQTEDDKFAVPPMENPGVIIRPGAFGSWTLQVEGYNRRTKVERIR